MGTPGVLWNGTKEDISDALKECKGIVSRTAKHLGISISTLYLKIDLYPSLKEYIAELRAEYVEELVDDAEEAMKKLIKNKDPNIVFKSSVFTLNNLGRKRGYNHPRVLEAQANSQLDEIIDG